MTFSKLIFPIFGLAVALYMITEQMIGSYTTKSMYYTFGLAIPVVVLSLVQIYKEFVANPANNSETRDGETDQKMSSEARTRFLAFIATTSICIVALPYLGYIISFSAFMVSTFLIMKMRKPVKIAALVIGTMSVVHFLFVVWLGTSLPKGSVWG